MPRSPRAIRTWERLSITGNPLENAILINRQRVAKSASSGGSSMTLWMVRQHYPAMDDEGMTTPSHPHRLAQPVYMPDQQITALPLQQINGKEICAAGMPGAAIVRHDNIERIHIRCNARLLTPYALCALQAITFDSSIVA
jgi:hypothetical protein